MKRFRGFIYYQNGFTIIELIIAIAITSVVLGAASTTVYQLVAGNSRNSNHITAIRQIQQTGSQISQDVLMAHDIVISIPDPMPEPSETPIILLNLYWTELTAFQTDQTLPGGYYIEYYKHRITYELLITDNGNNPLTRRHYISDLIYKPTDPDNPEPYTGFDLDFNIAWPENPAFTDKIAGFISSFDFGTDLSTVFPEYELVVTATVPGFQSVSETRTYDIRPRPESEGGG